MIGTIQFRERGSTPRGLAKELNNMKRRSALIMADRFHEKYRPLRFTHAHAREAGYALRRGEDLPRGSKMFRRSYTGKKLRKFGHTYPLVYSGRSRDAARRAAISATATGTRTTARVAYGGLNVFNFRQRGSKVNMSMEFRRIIPSEATQLARVYDDALDRELKNNPATLNTKLY